jgi:hypothetical protein
MSVNWKARSLIAAAIIAFVAMLLLGYHGLTYCETAENVQSVSWLPEGATNISYYRSYRFTAYEFDISEEGFQEWAKRWGQVQPIKDPVRVNRFSTLIQPPSNVSTSSIGQMEVSGTEIDPATATISDGYFYEKRQSNGGGVCVAYNSKAKRAYFQSNPR